MTESNKKYCKMLIFSHSQLILAILQTIYFSIADAASIYKCTEADGSITFSNTVCPNETVTREYKGETIKRQPSTNPAINQYYAPNYVQADSLKQNSNRFQQKKSTGTQSGLNNRIEPPPTPALTYDQARHKALKATGYRNYGNLSKSQKSRVDAEIAKYEHLPRGVDQGFTQSRALIDAQRARKEEEDRIHQVERTYKRERKWQEIGIIGRDFKYNRAVKDCKNTFKANCK